MKNIDKAEKALQKASVRAFLEGRKCSFMNGYHEKTDYVDITIGIAYHLGNDKASIIGNMACNGWNNKVEIPVTSRSTLKSLDIQIAEMLANFRQVVGRIEY